MQTLVVRSVRELQEGAPVPPFPRVPRGTCLCVSRGTCPRVPRGTCHTKNGS